MGRNRVSNDLNHVNDESTVTIKAKKSSSKPWLMPQFQSLHIKNYLQHDFDKLSQNVSRTSHNIFSLFFIEEILTNLIKYTNDYAALQI